MTEACDGERAGECVNEDAWIVSGREALMSKPARRRRSGWIERTFFAFV